MSVVGLNMQKSHLIWLYDYDDFNPDDYMGVDDLETIKKIYQAYFRSGNVDVTEIYENLIPDKKLYLVVYSKKY